jgi:hypothetical protein
MLSSKDIRKSMKELGESLTSKYTAQLNKKIEIFQESTRSETVFSILEL